MQYDFLALHGQLQFPFLMSSSGLIASPSSHHFLHPLVYCHQYRQEFICLGKTAHSSYLEWKKKKIECHISSSENGSQLPILLLSKCICASGCSPSSSPGPADIIFSCEMPADCLRKPKIGRAETHTGSNCMSFHSLYLF